MAKDKTEGSLKISYELFQQGGPGKKIRIKVNRTGNGLKADYAGPIADLKDEDIDAIETIINESIGDFDGAEPLRSAYVEIARNVGRAFYATAEYLSGGELPDDAD